MKTILSVLLSLIVAGGIVSAGQRILPTGPSEVIREYVLNQIEYVQIVIYKTDGQIQTSGGLEFTGPSYRFESWTKELVDYVFAYAARKKTAEYGKTNTLTIITYSSFMRRNEPPHTGETKSYLSLSQDSFEFLVEAKGTNGGLVPPEVKLDITEGVWIPVKGMLKDVVLVDQELFFKKTPSSPVEVFKDSSPNGGCLINGEDISYNGILYLYGGYVNLDRLPAKYGWENWGRITLHLRGGGKEVYDTSTGEMISTDRLRLEAIPGGKITLTGVSGTKAMVEVSEGFDTWSSVGSVTLDSTGKAEFQAIGTQSVGTRRFFRAKIVP
jgi:hypothetical protein